MLTSCRTPTGMCATRPHKVFRSAGAAGACNKLTCKASTQQPLDSTSPDRRTAVSALAAAALCLCTPVSASWAAASPAVGTFLPKYPGSEEFVEFVPDRQRTPAIRAGTVDRDHPYRFGLPLTWKEMKVANIQSGNYCQPRCAEPWTEVIFTDEAEGRAQVIVSPLVRLTNKSGATIDEVGSPSGVLESIGAFITGTYLDVEDVVSQKVEHFDDGRKYYIYEVNAPYGTVGPHSLTACTTKGDLALLFIVSANDKQWSRTEPKLRKLVKTFRA